MMAIETGELHTYYGEVASRTQGIDHMCTIDVNLSESWKLETR